MTEDYVSAAAFKKLEARVGRLESRLNERNRYIDGRIKDLDSFLDDLSSRVNEEIVSRSKKAKMPR